jgi:hypothetical protein
LEPGALEAMSGARLTSPQNGQQRLLQEGANEDEPVSLF